MTAGSSSVRQDRTAGAFLLAALLMTATLPLARLGRSLWSDEASSVWFARLPVSTLLTALCDPHPPGYYLLLKAWMALGDSEPWLRLLSVLAGMIAVVLTYLLGRAFCNRRCAALAALLLATQPMFLWYATEARMYAWVLALGVALVLLGWRWLARAQEARSPAVGLTASYGALALIALLVDYSTLLPLGAVQLLWIVRGRPQPRHWFLLHSGVLLPYLLWAAASPQRLALAHSYQPILLAVQARRLGWDLTPGSAAVVLAFFAFGVLVGSIVIAWQWSQRPPRWRPLYTYGIIAIWLALLVFAGVPRLYTLKRLLVTLLPYVAVVSAMSLSQVSWPVTALMLGVGFAMSLFVLGAPGQEPWREVVSELAAEPRPYVWVDDLGAPALDYYAGRVENNNPSWAPLSARELPVLPSLAPPPGDDLWLILLENPYRDLAPFLPPEFRSRYDLETEKHVSGLGVYRFKRRLLPRSNASTYPAPTLAQTWGLQLASPGASCR